MDLHIEDCLDVIILVLSYPPTEAKSSPGRRLRLVATGWLFRHRKGETCSCGPLVVAKEDLYVVVQLYLEHTVAVNDDAIVV